MQVKDFPFNYKLLEGHSLLYTECGGCSAQARRECGKGLILYKILKVRGRRGYENVSLETTTGMIIHNPLSSYLEAVLLLES
jgi:hypothetical protein